MIVAIWELLFSECETILGSLELSGENNVFIQAGQGCATMTARKKQPRRDSAQQQGTRGGAPTAGTPTLSCTVFTETFQMPSRMGSGRRSEPVPQIHLLPLLLPW